MDVTLQVQVNGGGLQGGGFEAEVGDVVQPTALSKSGWEGQIAWQLHSYPPSYPTPAGWTLDPDGTIYALGADDPDPFTMSLWGKYGLRLVVNGVVDEETAISVLSPSGLRDFMRREGAHFGGQRLQWPGDQQRNLRAIEATVAAAGAGVVEYEYATPITPGIESARLIRVVDALAGNLVFNAPTGLVDGAIVVFEVFEDGTGGRTVSWNAAYDFPTGLSGACLTPNTTTRWLFVVDAVNAKLRCLHRQFSVASPFITPPTLSGDVTDYTPTGVASARRLRIDPGAAARVINSLAAGFDGERKTIENISATAGRNLTLLHDNTATGTAAMRFLGANNTSAIVRCNGAVDIEYDGSSSRWRVLGL